MFRPGSLCALHLGKKQLMRLIRQWRLQCPCIAKVSSDAHTDRRGGVGFCPVETALSAIQSKKATVSSTAARIPGEAAFLSTATTTSYFETAVDEEKHGWGLNEEQLTVVQVETAFVRLVAGPGSGKTRVLTHRIAHMINNLNVPPRSILCVTFTKRAAQELCERLDTLLGMNVSSQIMVGTFHSVCARILRRSAQISDYNLNMNYIIYDRDNSEQIVKRILQEALHSFNAMDASIRRECSNGDADFKHISTENLDESVKQRSQSAIWEDLVRNKFLTENAPARSQLLEFLECYIKMKPEQKKRMTVTSNAVQDLLNIIRTARLHNVQAFIAKNSRKPLHPSSDSPNAFAFKMAVIYELELRRCNAADFDDLLYLVVQLLHRYPHILKVYRDIWKHVLVDEFQDIDEIQYEFVRLLSIGNASLFIVGDADQAIYGWRGASSSLMQYALDCDFPEIITFQLTRNYRSSSNIVKVASLVLRNIPYNWKRGLTEAFNLVPMKPPGEPIRIEILPSPIGEAMFIATEIQMLVKANLAMWGSFAILFRTHVQSSWIEACLTRLQIPHSVLGPLPFFSHKEIKYVIAYLQFVSNDENQMALESIINVPARGIGQHTLAQIKQWASCQNLTLPRALQFIHVEEIGHEELNITPEARDSLLQFSKLIEELRILSHSETVVRTMDAVIERTDFKSYVKKLDDSEKSCIERLDRLSVLQTIADLSAQKYGTGQSAHLRFLQEISFVSDRKSEMGEGGKNFVKLMTLHAAKGLEFDCVFITGLQEDLLPLSGQNVSEERRLFYVGVTRAMQRLYITLSTSNIIEGEEIQAEPSRFLNDIVNL